MEQRPNPDQSPEESRLPEDLAESEETFEQALERLEREVQGLRDRYEQVQRDQNRQTELSLEAADIRRSLKRQRSRELQATLKTINQELTQLEVSLESRLLSWRSVREPFWQIVRYGGLGVVLGWLLRSCSG